jgi:hypothetical protein
VDLAMGIMINPGSQPTVKEMVRLGMGPTLDYKMTFACGTPSHLPVFYDAMGALGEGFVVSGGFPPLTDMNTPGIKFCNELQAKYRPGRENKHIMYVAGIIEAMIQVEALRLAGTKLGYDNLTPRDVLENGFYMIKNLDTGGLSAEPLTYGKGDIEGVSKIRIDQIVNGKMKLQGIYEARHIY